MTKTVGRGVCAAVLLHQRTFRLSEPTDLGMTDRERNTAISERRLADKALGTSYASATYHPLLCPQLTSAFNNPQLVWVFSLITTHQALVTRSIYVYLISQYGNRSYLDTIVNGHLVCAASTVVVPRSTANHHRLRNLCLFA